MGFFEDLFSSLNRISIVSVLGPFEFLDVLKISYIINSLVSPPTCDLHADLQIGYALFCYFLTPSNFSTTFMMTAFLGFLETIGELLNFLSPAHAIFVAFTKTPFLEIICPISWLEILCFLNIDLILVA